jgi:membrane-bound lytic murein transglycosylase D
VTKYRGPARSGPIVFVVLLSVFMVPALHTSGESLALPRHPQHTVLPSYQPLHTAYLPVQQDLPGEKLYSLDIPSNSYIDYWISHYTKPDKIDWIVRSLQRGSVYRRFIVAKIKESELPRELLYLPVVESAYFPYAMSRSGAVGLWQFMKNSIGPYNISINSWVDERRDFWKATEAALHKLKLNYSRLHNWPSSIAAYNCGLTRMRRIVEENGTNDYWELLEMGVLPRETAFFIPKLFAISYICSHRIQYGLPISWDRGTSWERIQLDQVVDLRILARKTGIPLPLLEQGNTELNYSITPPLSEGYFLKIPAIYTEIITEALKEKEKFVDYHMYTIQSGDTLSELGDYYGISTDLLLRYNPGVKATRLRIGSTLIVPLVKDIPMFPGKNPGHQGGPGGPGGPDEKTNFSDSYIVQEGDTLWSISRRYKITPETLAKQNSIPLHFPLQIGQALRVPRLTIIEWERRSGNIPR